MVRQGQGSQRILSLKDQSVEYSFLTMAIDGGSADDAQTRREPTKCSATRSLRRWRHRQGSVSKNWILSGLFDSHRSSVHLSGSGGVVNLQLLELNTLIQSPRLKKKIRLKSHPLFELEWFIDSDEDCGLLHKVCWEGHSYGFVEGDQHSISNITVQDLKEAWSKQKERGLILLGSGRRSQNSVEF